MAKTFTIEDTESLKGTIIANKKVVDFIRSFGFEPHGNYGGFEFYFRTTFAEYVTIRNERIRRFDDEFLPLHWVCRDC